VIFTSFAKHSVVAVVLVRFRGHIQGGYVPLVGSLLRYGPRPFGCSSVSGGHGASWSGEVWFGLRLGVSSKRRKGQRPCANWFFSTL
jgi:hypothetical protein